MLIFTVTVLAHGIIAYDFFAYGYMSTPETAIKGQYSRSIQSTGQGVAPYRNESTGKFDETSNLITEWHDYYTTESGSNLTILGFDPSDTNATPIWEKLAQATNSGSTTAELNSGTFTAKNICGFNFMIQILLIIEIKLHSIVTAEQITKCAMQEIWHQMQPKPDKLNSKWVIGDGMVQLCIIFLLLIQITQINIVFLKPQKPDKVEPVTRHTKTELVGQWDDNAEVTSVQMSSENSGGAVDIGADSFITVWGFDP